MFGYVWKKLYFCSQIVIMNNMDAVMMAGRVTPDNIRSLEPGQIFVFGSNANGFHGGGAAAAAVRLFGAVYGQGDGLQGQSYAISTMEGMAAMRDNVNRFIAFAREHPELTFLVTRIGCGIAGYTADEVAPLFHDALGVGNIWLPGEFWKVLVGNEDAGKFSSWNKEKSRSV